MNRDEALLRHLFGLAPDGDGQDDGPLLGRYLDGRDEAAFEVLLRRHGRMVLGVCRRVLGNEADADDAFQAAFLVLARKAGSLRDRVTIGNWLYGVAVHTSLKLRALEQARRARERRRPAPTTRPEGEHEELRQVLDEELSRLPERFRQAVVLCDLEGLSRREAARRLGVAEGTLSGRLTTARRRLATRLTRRGITVPATLVAAGLAALAPAAVPPALARAALSALSGPGVSVTVETIAREVITMMALSGQKRLAAVLAVLLTTAGMGTALDRLAAHRPAPPGDIPRRLAVAEPDPTKRKLEFPGATLDLKADAVVPAGAPVVVTVTLTNTADKPLTYWCGGPGRYPGLNSTLAEVTGADGRASEAALTNGQYVQGSGTNEQVAPGQSISFPALLHARPRAGTYTLRVGKGKPARITVKADARLLRKWEEDLLTQVRQGEPFAQHVAREHLSPWLREALFQDLVSDDGKHVLEAARTLVMLQQFPPGTDARLRKVMTHHLGRRKAGGRDDGLFHCLAIMAGRFESDDALDTVLDLAHSLAPGETRAHAVWHLRSFKQAKALRALHALLNDANQSVRQTAAQILGERKDPAALPPLLALAADPQNPHRASALRALLHFPDDPRVEPALRRGLEEADEGARTNARRLLDELAQKRKRE